MKFSEIMGFVRIFWKNNVQEAYLPKMSIWGQIVSEIVAQLCLQNSIQTLLNFFGVDPKKSIFEQIIQTKTFIKRLLSCSIKVNALKVVKFCQKQNPPEISRFQTNQLHALSMWEKLHSMSYPQENKKGVKHEVKVV